MTIYVVSLITVHDLFIGRGNRHFPSGQLGVCAISGVCATTLFCDNSLKRDIEYVSTEILLRLMLTNCLLLLLHAILAAYFWVSAAMDALAFD